MSVNSDFFFFSKTISNLEIVSIFLKEKEEEKKVELLASESAYGHFVID